MMDTPESWAIAFLAIFVFVSFSFSLVKAAFSAIYAKRDARDRESREERVAALVEMGGFNETVSIGRIFCNVGAGVLGFYLFQESQPASNDIVLQFWDILADPGLKQSCRFANVMKQCRCAHQDEKLPILQLICKRAACSDGKPFVQ